MLWLYDGHLEAELLISCFFPRPHVRGDLRTLRDQRICANPGNSFASSGYLRRDVLWPLHHVRSSLHQPSLWLQNNIDQYISII